MNDHLQQGLALLKDLVETNWGVFAGIVGAFFTLKVIKAGFNIVLGILFAGLAIAILTNAGAIPPLRDLLEGVRNLVL